jgi:hypothetical protein
VRIGRFLLSPMSLLAGFNRVPRRSHSFGGTAVGDDWFGDKRGVRPGPSGERAV